MKVFSFKAKNEKGKIVEDTVAAFDEENAASLIASHNLEVLTIKEQLKARGSIFSRKVSVSEKAALCRFLATMLRSGMSIPEAVDIIREESGSKRLRRILSDISFQTQKGKSLSMVLSSYEDEFGEVFLTMVRVGEESGTLEKSFDYLSEQLTASHELTQKITGALMYPGVIVLAMIGNALMMTLFVLPRISEAFIKLEVPLPFYTRILLSSGVFLGENTFLVVEMVALVILGVGILLFVRRTRMMMVAMMIRLPAIRGIVKDIDIARFSRTLSTLLRSGVAIVSALDVSVNVLTQRAFKREAEMFSKGVARGESLSSVLMANRGLFPGTMIQTIRAGERSGNLEEVLAELAQFYEREIEFSLKRFTALLEPVLMLAIGVVVGLMVLAMIAPIYSIIGGLQQGI